MFTFSFLEVLPSGGGSNAGGGGGGGSVDDVFAGTFRGSGGAGVVDLKELVLLLAL